MIDPILSLIEDPETAENRRQALGFVTEAFADAIMAGVESEDFAHAAIFAALQELVAIHGEDHAATFAKTLPQRIITGEFSLTHRH
jgi:alcohol dehydrogenase YqhD (iron-dependent ADH family)